jgi:hypothetical protein
MPTLQALAQIASKLLANLPQVPKQPQPETNRFGILLADALAKEIVGADAERHVWSHSKLDVHERLTAQGSKFHTRELLVDVNVWACLEGTWRLVVAAECEAAPYQRRVYDRRSWWDNGYLFDLAKLLRMKAKHILFIGRTSSVKDLKEAIEFLLADAPALDLTLSEDQVLWLTILDHTARAQSCVGVARFGTSVQWEELVAMAPSKPPTPNG